MLIFVAYVILAALLLWIVIGAKGYWKIKLPVMIITLLFGFGVWHALGSYEGWPATDNPPKESLFVNCLVREPDPTTNDDGAIYFWLIPLHKASDVLGYRSSTQEPRAYGQPYTRALHQMCVDVQKTAANRPGAPIAIKATSTSGKGKNGQKIPKWAFRPYILPPPGLPRKSG